MTRSERVEVMLALKGLLLTAKREMPKVCYQADFNVTRALCLLDKLIKRHIK